jgi:hypothetical protein
MNRLKLLKRLMIMSVLVFFLAPTFINAAPVTGTSLYINDETTGVNSLSLSTLSDSTSSMIGGFVSEGPSTGDGEYTYSISSNSAINYGSNQSANASRGTLYRSTTGGITDLSSRTYLGSTSTATSTGTSQEATLTDTSVGTSNASTSSNASSGSSYFTGGSSTSDLVGGSSIANISAYSSTDSASINSSSLQSDSAGNSVGSGISTNANLDNVSTFGLNLGQYTTSSWMNGYVGSITSDPTTGGDIANTYIG